MSRLLLPSVALMTALATPARADVNELETSGFHLESGAPGDMLVAKGSFNTGPDVLKVRIECAKGCPVKGRAKLECTVGEGFCFDWGMWSFGAP
jgi:hypothetical protein